MNVAKPSIWPSCPWTFFFNLFFTWRIIALEYCVVSAMHQHESPIGVHMSPPSWTSLPLPSHPTPLGCYTLYSFALIKRLFSSSSLSALKVVSSAYLRWLIFLPAILIPACNSSSPAFRLMCSAYTLNKQGDSVQPCVLLSQFWTSQLFHIRF